MVAVKLCFIVLPFTDSYMLVKPVLQGCGRESDCMNGPYVLDYTDTEFVSLAVIMTLSNDFV